MKLISCALASFLLAIVTSAPVYADFLCSIAESSTHVRVAVFVIDLLIRVTKISPGRFISAGLVTIGGVQPSVVDEGGVVRVGLTSPLTVPYCGNSSGQASNLDFLFTNGTQEGRSAFVAALYLALAESKQVTFLLSSAGCSPYGSPVVVGI